MNSSCITWRPGVHRVATQNDNFTDAFVCQDVHRNEIVMSESLHADAILLIRGYLSTHPSGLITLFFNVFRSSLIRAHIVCFHDECSLECILIYAVDVKKWTTFLGQKNGRIRVKSVTELFTV